METTRKICKKCLSEKTLDMFFNNPKTKDGKFSSCKECEKKKYNDWRRSNPEIRARTKKREYLRKHHRLELGQFEEMMKAQNNRCYICNHEAKVTKDPRTKFLQVDHCHKTGKVRKLLCHQCNRALGLLKESPELFMKCISYVKEHNDYAASA